MASSDNVIRGGLTTKHIAVDELVRVVDFGWGEPEVIDATETAPGVFNYPTHGHEFDVWRLELAADAPLELPSPEGARIVLVTRGTVVLSDEERTLELSKGDSVFVPATNPAITASGDAQAFLAAPGLA